MTTTNMLEIIIHTSSLKFIIKFAIVCTIKRNLLSNIVTKNLYTVRYTREKNTSSHSIARMCQLFYAQDINVHSYTRTAENGKQRINAYIQYRWIIVKREESISIMEFI